jgi:hypothetical protein
MDGNGAEAALDSFSVDAYGGWPNGRSIDFVVQQSLI